MGKMELIVSRVFVHSELNNNDANVYRFFALLGEISYKDCSTFNDMSGPAMINTFNDINKLVQARKL